MLCSVTAKSCASKFNAAAGLDVLDKPYYFRAPARINSLPQPPQTVSANLRQILFHDRGKVRGVQKFFLIGTIRGHHRREFSGQGELQVRDTVALFNED